MWLHLPAGRTLPTKKNLSLSSTFIFNTLIKSSQIISTPESEHSIIKSIYADRCENETFSNSYGS